MKISKAQVNEQWTEYTLENDTGIRVRFLNYGGIITEMITPDQHDQFENIVLAYQHYEDYEHNPNYLGAIIGRVAGRIEQAEFSLHETSYQLEKNEGNHHLHGGSSGLHQVIWRVEPFESACEVGATLFYRSPNGEGGYPGDVEITVTYTLTNDDQFIIDYDAITNEPTILSLTNHSYFNLSGNLKRTVHEHFMQIQADEFVEINRDFGATGNMISVVDTPFDFRKGKYLQAGMTSDHLQNKRVNHGYDHYFLFNGKKKPEIVVDEPRSGRVLTVETSQPGVVLYTSNQLNNSLVLKERLSEQYLGFCLETQEHAASLKHNHFPSVIINEDDPYKKQTIFSFKTKQKE